MKKKTGKTGKIFKKGTLWRKALAVSMTLLIVSGSAPVQLFSQVAGHTALAADVAGKTENLNGYTFTIERDREGNYYKIDCADALIALADYVNAGNHAKEMRFKQTADIDMKDVAFTPIGNEENKQLLLHEYD